MQSENNFSKCNANALSTEFQTEKGHPTINSTLQKPIRIDDDDDVVVVV